MGHLTGNYDNKVYEQKGSLIQGDVKDAETKYEVLSDIPGF